ncbi:acyltransferase [Cryobacterium breve]|uniref:Acyltransferase n=1 Tax=Cryobacterium breve TaxID=1259258 RepID=A0ABY7NFW5_9MICO|nr:acyltransferase [Cryobacterium breve]
MVDPDPAQVPRCRPRVRARLLCAERLRACALPLAARAIGTGYDWVAYYPRRIIRLAIPVVVSVALAAAWILLVPRTGIDVGGSWLKRQDSPDIGLPNLLGEASVIGGSGRPDVNPPLWSLTWEMWFSLLLPICVLLAVATRRLPALWAAAFLAVSATGYVTGIEPLMYLPAFGLGALLAANYESLRTWAARVAARRGGTAVWIGLTALGPALLVSHWLLRPQLSGLWGDLTLALRVPGAVLVVAVVALWPPLQRPLSARPLVWLGTVSFSLYLVHFPVVVAFGTMFGPGRWWLGALVSVPLSLVLAQLMYLWVELPAQRLATWTGRWASEKAGALRGRGGRQADAAASADLAARAPENDRALAE